MMSTVTENKIPMKLNFRWRQDGENKDSEEYTEDVRFRICL